MATIQVTDVRTIQRDYCHISSHKNGSIMIDADEVEQLIERLKEWLKGRKV